MQFLYSIREGSGSEQVRFEVLQPSINSIDEFLTMIRFDTRGKLDDL
jgi:hypothetical protein